MRSEPDQSGGELEMLLQYLDYQRETVLLKAEGLDHRQLGEALPPSTLTLGGLLRHLTLVEEIWVEVRFAGLPEREPWVGVNWDADPDWEFRTAADIVPDDLRDRYQEAGERTRAVVLAAGDPDQLSVAPRDGHGFTLRWVLLHLIEETARHAGHADFLRQAVDGATGE